MTERRKRNQAAAKPGQPVSDLLPDRPTLPVVREIAAICKACDLYKRGTQTVFGEGPPKAELMLVGEQPGDAEDLAGHPFVGPAGRLLDTALEEAGIDRSQVYVTNVVKHFKFTRSGKRRIHQTPDSGEIEACRPWLFRELEIVKPSVLVCLGATAAKAAFGSSFRISKSHGHLLESKLAARTLATIHPSAALRAPDSAGRRRLYRQLVDDLRVASRAAASRA
jgi:DNA polymerase